MKFVIRKKEKRRRGRWKSKSSENEEKLSEQKKIARIHAEVVNFWGRVEAKGLPAIQRGGCPTEK